MMTLLYAYLIFMGATVALQILYLSATSLMAADKVGRIPPETRRMWLAYVKVATLYDIFYNITIGTVFFLKYPQDLTLSYRLIRYKREGGWRGKMAAYICRNLLDPFDPSGCHCKS